MVGAMSATGKTELFFSKSKSKQDLGKQVPADWRRRLSNFWPVQVTIDGRTYPSVEAAFQAAKALHSDKPEMAKDFEVGGSVGPDPAAAKQHGTRKLYAAKGAKLKTKEWEAARDAAMMKILQARYDQDEVFRQILEATKALNVNLVHYERSGAKAYWGGSVKEGVVQGRNRLGEMMMALREGEDSVDAAAALADAELATVAGDVAEEAAAAAAPAPVTDREPVPSPAAAPAGQEPPSMATMGRASESVGAVSFIRKLFTARATLLTQLTSLGHMVEKLQSVSPADVDRQFQDKELNFVVSGMTPGAHMKVGDVHVRFHIDKALRHIHIGALVEEFEKMDKFGDKSGFLPERDTIVLIAKDMPNDSVKAAVSSAWAQKGIYIVVRGLAELQFNVLTHKLVPYHRKLEGPNDLNVQDPHAKMQIKRLYNKDGTGKSILPGISRFDPVAKAILMRPGQVCMIIRPSPSAGYYSYYRRCE